VQYRRVVVDRLKVGWEKIFLADHLKSIKRVANDRLPIFFYLRRDKTKAIQGSRRPFDHRASDNFGKRNRYCCCANWRASFRQVVNSRIVEKVLTGPGLIVHSQDVKQR
jgi:hypothetical protein